MVIRVTIFKSYIERIKAAEKYIAKWDEGGVTKRRENKHDGLCVLGGGKMHLNFKHPQWFYSAEMICISFV